MKASIPLLAAGCGWFLGLLSPLIGKLVIYGIDQTSIQRGHAIDVSAPYFHFPQGMIELTTVSFNDDTREASNLPDRYVVIAPAAEGTLSFYRLLHWSRNQPTTIVLIADQPFRAALEEASVKQKNGVNEHSANFRVLFRTFGPELKNESP